MAGTAPIRMRLPWRCTLIVLRVPDQETPWVVPTDEPPTTWTSVPTACGSGRTGLRHTRRMGWQWKRTRRTDPARVDRHWLVLATLRVLAHGTRVEKALTALLAGTQVS